MSAETDQYPPTPAGRVLDCAIAIAAYAPAKQSKYAFAAQIPWTLIHELRAGLDALDIPWRKEDR